ncbi:hypothetical protein HY480_02575 [Candidatus Uhrbacteria bacterium]|nr:hypothetical protein [Candidatus Uhrbacteria bacterium]
MTQHTYGWNRSLAWMMISTAALSCLMLLMRMRFTSEGGTAVYWVGVVGLVVLFMLGLHILRRSALHPTGTVDGDTQTGNFRMRILAIADGITALPDDADAARVVIEGLGREYRELSEALASNRGALPNHLDVQMELGDAMVATQRVWTTLADGAIHEAQTAWHTARAHAARLRALLGA